MKIKYICNAVLWFDKVNGNTYHSCRITRASDGAVIYCPFEYGYGNHYRQTALEAMAKSGWMNGRYSKNPYLFERENDYPIYWAMQYGTKKECVQNGEEPK